VALVRASAELAADWSVMLAHQLRLLPPIEQFLDRLPDALQWIDGIATSTPQLSPIPVQPGEQVFRPRGSYYWQSPVALESVRFAGTNRLLIEFDYRDAKGDPSHRVVEPYSFRLKGTGNRLLYAWDLGASDIRSFNTRSMSGLQVTGRSFIPRYLVEFVG
jgi:hypothetical protein